MAYSLVRSLIPLLLHTMLFTFTFTRAYPGVPLLFCAGLSRRAYNKLGHDIILSPVGTRCRLSLVGTRYTIKTRILAIEGEQWNIPKTRVYTVWTYIPGVPVEFPVTTRRDNPEPATQRHNYTTPASVPSRNVTQLSVCDDDSRRGGLRGGRVGSGGAVTGVRVRATDLPSCDSEFNLCRPRRARPCASHLTGCTIIVSTAPAPDPGTRTTELPPPPTSSSTPPTRPVPCLYYSTTWTNMSSFVEMYCSRRDAGRN